MIKIKDKTKCCGCFACMNACPKNCIRMESDSEGFLYPKVEESKCINCHLCEKVCPILNPKEEKPFEQKGYVVQNRNEQELKESTSGGFFTPVAKYVIEHGGIVFGAAFDENLKVVHIGIDRKDELWKFRNSKYVQSEMGNCFSEIKKYLNIGRLVCFSGTPCQVEGLISFLGTSHDNLILVDIVCRAVPSPLLWEKYKLYLRENKKIEFNYAMFRDKTIYDYNYSNISIRNNFDIKYHAGIEKDPYLNAFFSDICNRPSCYDCKFKKRYRISDFTMWDCFTGKFSRKIKLSKGITRVLINSEKGLRIFNIIEKNFVDEKVDSDQLVRGVYEMTKSVPYNKRERHQFFMDLSHDNINVFEKYFKCTLYSNIRALIRILLCKIHLTEFIKKICQKKNS